MDQHGIAALCKAVMKRHNLQTAAELARHIDVPERTVAYWINGVRSPRPHQIARLRHAAGIPAPKRPAVVDMTPAEIVAAVVHDAAARTRSAVDAYAVIDAKPYQVRRWRLGESLPSDAQLAGLLAMAAWPDADAAAALGVVASWREAKRGRCAGGAA